MLDESTYWESEDSETLNTSFVERLNLTIRQASACLRRRSPCHPRGADQLRSHVELMGCHYNFVRPHRALRFERETRTPAMQAGLVSTRLAMSDIFTARRVTLRVLVALVETGAAECPTLSWPPRTTNGCLINSERRKHRRAGPEPPWYADYRWGIKRTPCREGGVHVIRAQRGLDEH